MGSFTRRPALATPSPRVRGEGRGEGRSRGRCGKDYVPNAFDILQDFIVPEMEDAIAALCQPLIAYGVAPVFGVLAAVDFDNESFLPTNKIDDIRPDGFLTHEFESTERSRTQEAPKLPFSLSGISPQSPGQPRLRHFCAAHASRPPHPNPLPARGKREQPAARPGHVPVPANSGRFQPERTHGLTSPRIIFSKPVPRSIIGGALVRAALSFARSAAVAASSMAYSSLPAIAVSTTP
jgi:hypothetical protein